MTTHRSRYPVIAAVVLAVIGVALLTPHHPHARTDPVAWPRSSTTAVSTPALTGIQAPNGSATPPAATSPAPTNGTDTETPAARTTWAPVVSGFARTFATPAPTRTWHARIQVWVTPHLADQFAVADPRLLDHTRVRSIVATTRSATMVACTITYVDGQIIRATVEASPTGWLVTAAQPGAPTRR